MNETWRTIVCDPPWSYNDKLHSGNTGFGKRGIRGAANHYETATTAEIGLIPVGTWAENDAHLYLWTTNAFMEEAHALARQWGFAQKTILTWVKPQIGMGHYYRNSTEHVLFCVRGSLKVLRHDMPTHFVAPRCPHSQKPDSFYDMVESMSPGPYLDVFARRHRMGWSVYGNEVYSAIPLVEATL